MIGGILWRGWRPWSKARREYSKDQLSWHRAYGEFSPRLQGWRAVGTFRAQSGDYLITAPEPFAFLRGWVGYLCTD